MEGVRLISILNKALALVFNTHTRPQGRAHPPHSCIRKERLRKVPECQAYWFLGDAARLQEDKLISKAHGVSCSL